MFVNEDHKTSWDSTPLGNTSHDNTLAGLSVLTENGLKFYDLGRHVCHGKLMVGSDYTPSRGEVKEIWTRLACLNKGVDEKIATIYYSWLISESPWAKAFIEKDYAACTKHGFRLDAGLPNDFVASATVATRWLTEKYESWTSIRYPLYVKLLDSGTGPLWAFIMANLYTPYKNSGLAVHAQNACYVFSMQLGHEMLPSDLNMEGLKNFVHGHYRDAVSFSKNRGYTSIGTAWNNAASLSPKLHNLAKQWCANKKEKIDLNIFNKPNLKSGYPVLSFEDLLQVMKQLQEQVYEKAVAA